MVDSHAQHPVDESLIDTAQTIGEHGLGRLYLEDPRDLNYQVPMLLAMEPSPESLPATKYYVSGPVLNQGQTSQCVEYSWNGYLMASPIRNKRITPPGTLYCEAQSLDPWEGDCSNPKYDGSSVRAGAQALQNRGLIQNYYWATTASDIAAWILQGKGPVVLGTRWFNSMAHTDDKGVLHVDPKSGLAGGHAYLCIGYNSRTRMFRFVNSWGTEWGQRGRFWMSFDDVETLLRMQGEACTSVELKLAG